MFAFHTPGEEEEEEKKDNKETNQNKLFVVWDYFQLNFTLFICHAS